MHNVFSACIFKRRLMKKMFHIIVLACMVFSFTMHAETVTQTHARKLAELFFNTAYNEKREAPKLIWNGRQLTTNKLFSPFYVFNHPSGGYVIISGDNKAYPVLAYSLNKNFDRSRLSEKENEMLKSFAREIELIRYDHRLPVNAIDAWQNIPNYFSKIIKSPYKDSEEFKRLTDEQKTQLEETDRTGKQIFMPSAVEFELYDPNKYRDINLDDVSSEEEYVPFKFYDDFINEIKHDQLAKERELEIALLPEKPVVTALGAGSYQIDYPEEITLVRVYSLNGMQVMERYFKNTQRSFIDLEGEGSGYYVCMALSRSGKVYGNKIAR